MIDTLENEDERKVFEAKLAYLRGEFEKSKNIFNAIDDSSPLKMCACRVTRASIISFGDKKLFE